MKMFLLCLDYLLSNEHKRVFLGLRNSIKIIKFFIFFISHHLSTYEFCLCFIYNLNNCLTPSDAGVVKGCCMVGWLECSVNYFRLLSLGQFWAQLNCLVYPLVYNDTPEPVSLARKGK